jgi:hypothetical protein
MCMRKRQEVDLWVEFTHAIVDDPSILEDVPEGATVVLIPDDDPELAEGNYQRAINAARRGSDVYIRHVTRATPTE